MTIEEKLEAMEALWSDLRRHEGAIAVHEWQKQVLKERERLVDEGTAEFIDWEQAKKDIARETS
jgi:hypothetical protein